MIDQGGGPHGTWWGEARDALTHIQYAGKSPPCGIIEPQMSTI